MLHNYLFRYVITQHYYTNCVFYILKVFFFNIKELSNIERRIDTFLDNAANQLHQYVHGPDFKSNVLKDVGKWNRITYRQKLNTRIERETLAWQQNHIDSIFRKDIVEDLMKSFENIHRSLHSIKEDLKGFKTPFDVDSKIAILLASVVVTGGAMFLGASMINRTVPHFTISKDLVVVSCAIAGMFDYFGVVDGFQTVCEKQFQAIIGFLTEYKLKKFLRETYFDVMQNSIKTFLDEDLEQEIGMLKNNIVLMRRRQKSFKSDKDILSSLKSAVIQNITRLKKLENLNALLSRDFQKQ